MFLWVSFIYRFDRIKWYLCLHVNYSLGTCTLPHKPLPSWSYLYIPTCKLFSRYVATQSLTKFFTSATFSLSNRSKSIPRTCSRNLSLNSGRKLKGGYMHVLWCYIVAASFIGEENQSTLRKPQTCRKSLTNFINKCCIEHTSLWVEFELTLL